MKCHYCQKEITRNLTLKELFFPMPIKSNFLCSICLSTFQFLDSQNCCITCQKQEINGQCEDCLYWKNSYPDYDFKHEALFLYNEEMSNWFKEYKFHGNYHLRHTFSDYLAAYFKTKKNALILPIPLSKNRMETRRFNQVEGMLLAANIPYFPYLVRTDNASSQVEKNKLARLNLVQPFLLKQDKSEQITNKSILLVDDIYTTGRTLFHAAEAIARHNPAEIRTFSLAR